MVGWIRYLLGALRSITCAMDFNMNTKDLSTGNKLFVSLQFLYLELEIVKDKQTVYWRFAFPYHGVMKEDWHEENRKQMCHLYILDRCKTLNQRFLTIYICTNIHIYVDIGNIFAFRNSSSKRIRSLFFGKHFPPKWKVYCLNRWGRE